MMDRKGGRDHSNTIEKTGVENWLKRGGIGTGGGDDESERVNDEEK